MSLDFTLNTYAQFCRAIKTLNCPVTPIRDFLAEGQPPGLRIILRHDVDRRLETALRLAKLEAEFGLSASYYLRTTRSIFKPRAIYALNQLGHEVGYHYETLSRARGNLALAQKLFGEELAHFRDIGPVETATMHGSPLSPWNNLEMWQTVSPADFNLQGEAYLDIDYSQAYYFTDTGRSWAGGRYNIRDHAPSLQPPQPIKTTAQLIAFLHTKPTAPIIINTHPNRWAANSLEWLMGSVADWAINQVKWGLALLRQSQAR